MNLSEDVSESIDSHNPLVQYLYVVYILDYIICTHYITMYIIYYILMYIIYYILMYIVYYKLMCIVYYVLMYIIYYILKYILYYKMKGTNHSIYPRRQVYTSHARVNILLSSNHGLTNG